MVLATIISSGYAYRQASSKMHKSIQDIIPGVMNWKTFPSPCLTAFQSDMKLISLWKPNLSNPFSSDLLPNSQQNQALMTGVQHDDIVDIKK